jgi:hypothetical protein
VSVLDLRALLGALVDCEVRFVVIGGVAVAAHGYVRATQDLDLVPDPSVENARRLASALAILEATFPLAAGRPFDPQSDLLHLIRRSNLTLDTRHGALDVVQDAPGVPPFVALDREAVDSELLGVPVRICSLDHLRGMKRARGGSQDRADLEHLPPSRATSG